MGIWPRGPAALTSSPGAHLLGLPSCRTSWRGSCAGSTTPAGGRRAPDQLTAPARQPATIRTTRETTGAYDGLLWSARRATAPLNAGLQGARTTAHLRVGMLPYRVSSHTRDQGQARRRARMWPSPHTGRAPSTHSSSNIAPEIAAQGCRGNFPHFARLGLPGVARVLRRSASAPPALSDQPAGDNRLSSCCHPACRWPD